MKLDDLDSRSSHSMYCKALQVAINEAAEYL